MPSHSIIEAWNVALPFLTTVAKRPLIQCRHADMAPGTLSLVVDSLFGAGEGPQDRVGLLHQLATLPEHPESVPINRLVAIKVRHAVNSML